MVTKVAVVTMVSKVNITRLENVIRPGIHWVSTFVLC
jgi:hypothetical protein